MAGLTFPVSCASLCYLLMAKHCCLCLNSFFNLPSASHLAPPLYNPTPLMPAHPLYIDAICDITEIEETSLKTRAFK